jgi:hypothetical protein
MHAERDVQSSSEAPRKEDAPLGRGGSCGGHVPACAPQTHPEPLHDVHVPARATQTHPEPLNGGHVPDCAPQAPPEPLHDVHVPPRAPQTHPRLTLNPSMTSMYLLVHPRPTLNTSQCQFRDSLKACHPLPKYLAG